MKQIGAFEAKTHFSKLLSQIGEGEEFMICIRNQPVAMLLPIKQENRVNEAINYFTKHKRKTSLTTSDFKKMVEQGRS